MAFRTIKIQIIAAILFGHFCVMPPAFSDPLDSDNDTILDDGNSSGIAGDYTCMNGETEACDDNCPNTHNPDQADSNGDGIGDLCPPTPVFGDYQAVSTNGALDWEFFSIDGEHYLAVANHHNDSTYNVDSAVLKWDGSSFPQFKRYQPKAPLTGKVL
ncbi:MAG: hypothetical protein GY703_25965 [Gammaproteobacteria bacterium]|nr:hypothetical protein [Gammaproteobacteria bacterium]